MNQERAKTVKTCARCGQPMVTRQNRESGEYFVGCSTWPDCQHTEPEPLDAQLRREGHEPLPGFH